MTKTRILHLVSTNQYSGAENVACTIIRHFQIEYKMAYCSPNGSIKNTLTAQSINYVPLEKFDYCSVKKVIQEYRPNIIHAHDYRASILASFFHHKALIVSHIHQNSPKMRSKNLLSWLFKWRAKNIDKIIWVSESAFKDYRYSIQLAPKSIVLPNIIDGDKVLKNSQSGSIEEQYDIIFLGRITPQKNPKRFIRIIAKLVKTQKNLKIAMVGDGEQRAIIEQLITENNLQNNIKLYGRVENPYPILANSKILVMTSVFEGTPMAALEAQCLGVPIVSTPTDGLLKIIQDGKNGFIALNNADFTEKITKILSDDVLYAKLSNNAKTLFRQENDAKSYFDKIKAIYETTYPKGNP